MKKKKLNKKIFMVFFVLVFLAIVFTVLIVSDINNRNRENSIFHIRELITYNSANVQNTSDSGALENLDISQYSDLSIYIDNNLKELGLTDENTIKELYIDNINISYYINNGEKILNYKNPFHFAEYEDLENANNNRIDFKIIKTNEENNTSEYSKPVFYTDCSNPITLGYINKNIIQNYSVPNKTNIVSYNAKVLKEAKINLTDLNATLNFTINIVNNINHHFSCDFSVNLYLDEDFLDTGYSYITTPFEKDEYKLIRE